VSGLVALVGVAELLAELAGSREAATRIAAAIASTGTAALPRRDDDVAIAVRHELVAHGVITDAGVVRTSRAAELMIVCEILAASCTPAPTPTPDPRLVLTAPDGAVPINDVERLDGLVLDVIRQARKTLHIGGAFWNEGGFELLNSVLVPALEVRNVATVLYVNEPSPEHVAQLDSQLDTLRARGSVRIRWFAGTRPTMLHAKFVIRDRQHGYLGTANLTSWGMRNHIEAGVELTPGQSERFVTFLEQLEAAGLFAPARPSHR
jgi:hypothetical protein